MHKVGDSIPSVNLKQMTESGPADVNAAEYCKDRTVVIFALPGAFTPTCSEQHVPGFLSNTDAIKAKGVDAIACLSTADFFVMDAWAKSLGVDGRIDMLSDGNGEFIKATGTELDLSGAGLGTRSMRYAMVVKNGSIEKLLVEENPGKADDSGADALLAAL